MSSTLGAPAPLRDKTCLVFNTIGPDREHTMREMLMHLMGCIFYDAAGAELHHRPLIGLQHSVKD